MFAIKIDTYKVQKVRPLQAEREGLVDTIRRELQYHVYTKHVWQGFTASSNLRSGESEA